MIQPVNSCTISPASQTAESLLQPAQSFKEVLQKQSVAEEENKDLGQRKVAAAFPSNVLPILPNLGLRNNLIKVDPSEVQSPGQPLNQQARMIQDPQAPSILSLPGIVENPEQNISAFPTAQTKGTFPQSELQAGLFLKQQEKTIASFSEVINELPEGQKKSLFVTGTTWQHAPWAMRNEGTREALPKSEFNGDLLGQKITLPGFSTDSPMLLAFDEKLDILLGQNSTGEEVPGRSWNGEFIGLENSSAEKNSPKGISGGENHPTQDPFGVNELLGGLKTATVVEETGIPQKLPLSRTEHPDPYQQIAEKVIWSIRNNEEKIRLTLEPPQLGNLFIELHRNKDEIKATLWVDNPKTKEILENNQFQLQKTLEGHGFKLEQYDVFVQNEMGSFQGKEESPVFQGQGSPTPSLQIEEAELPASLEIPSGAIPASGGSQYIDRFI